MAVLAVAKGRPARTGADEDVPLIRVGEFVPSLATDLSRDAEVAFGQEEWSPPARSSVGSRFSQRTLVATLRNGRGAPIADLHSTRAWGMPLDYRLSYASLPEAG